MTTKELYDLCPYGAFVTFSDGTPKPPPRHTKKIAKWERSNGQGYFVKADPPYNYEGAVGGVTIQLIDSDVLVYNYGISLNSNLTFNVTLPPPGTVLAYREWREAFEVNHVHKDLNAYIAWCQRNRYEPFGHGGQFWIINEKGEREELEKSPVAAA
jgi:hypothetical protein